MVSFSGATSPGHPLRRPLVLGVSFTLISIIVPCCAGQASQPTPAVPQRSVSLKDLTIEQLSQVEVVSPRKEPTQAFRSPVAIYVLTGDDIRRSGATTIPDALRQIPGLEVAQIDASKWSIGIRGFGSRFARAVLVLIDGRTVYTPLLAGTFWEVQDTLMQDVDRIEVIRGPGGTIWGPNAVNGIINIITKNSKDTQGAYARLGGGSTEQGILGLRYGGQRNDLAYRVYLKSFSRGPQFHPDGDNFDDWRGIQGGFRMDWGQPNRDAFTFQGDLYAQSDGERVSFTTYTPPVTRNMDGAVDASGGNLMFKWKRTFSPDSDFQLQAFYDHTHRTEPNFGENRDTFDLDLFARTRFGRRQELLYGIEGRGSDRRFQEVETGLVFSPLHRLDYLFTAFLEDDIQLVSDKLLLTLGSKALRTNFSAFSLEPSARLMYTPNAKHTLWASFTHAIRTPSDAEEDFYLSSLIATTPQGLPEFARFDPNPRFAPEQLNAYEAGYRNGTKSLYVDFASFYNNYHNLFSQDVIGGLTVQNTLPFPAPAPPPTYVLLSAQFQNDLYGPVYGGEIAPQWQPKSFWRMRGSYDFLRMSLHQGPTTQTPLGPASTIGSSPQHQLKITSSMDLTRRFQVDLMYRYVSALPALKVPSYSSGDVRSSFRVSGNIWLSVVGQNLLQPHHFEFGGDPGGLVGIRRSVYAYVSWSKNQ